MGDLAGVRRMFLTWSVCVAVTGSGVALAQGRGGGAPGEPPGCAGSAASQSIPDAFATALQRWLRPAERAYRSKYRDLAYSYDLTVAEVDAREAFVQVDFEASVYEVELDTRTDVSGTVDLWFARTGCSWRLVKFEY